MCVRRLSGGAQGRSGKERRLGLGCCASNSTTDQLLIRLLEWAGPILSTCCKPTYDRYACVTVEGKFVIAGHRTPPPANRPILREGRLADKAAPDYTTVEWVEGKVKNVLKVFIKKNNIQNKKGQVVANSPAAPAITAASISLPAWRDDGNSGLKLWGRAGRSSRQEAPSGGL